MISYIVLQISSYVLSFNTSSSLQRASGALDANSTAEMMILKNMQKKIANI